MHRFITLVFILFTINSFAQPGMDDWVIYDQAFNANGFSQRVELTQKIIAVDEGPQYLISQRRSDGQDYDYWVPSGQLRYVEDTREYCKAHPSPSELKKLKLVQTQKGPLLTCQIRRRDNTHSIWYAAEVPFGVYQELTEFPGGETFIQIAKDYGWGDSE